MIATTDTRRSRRCAWLIVIVTSAIMLGMPARAPAMHWFKNPQDSVIHIHTRVYDTLNEIDESPAWASDANAARAEWHGDTILDLPLTTNHSIAELHLVDGHFGWTGWAGLATNNGNMTQFDSDAAGHYGHAHSIMNDTYRIQLGYEGRRAVACQEMGHQFGLWHGSWDCMNYGYASTSYVVGQDSINDINWFYQNYGH